MADFLLGFLVVPGISLALLVYALYQWRRNIRKAKKYVLAAFICGWVLAMPAFGHLMLFSLAGLINGPADISIENIDLIVVPTDGMTNMGDIGWLPTESTFKSAAVAHELQNRINSRIPILVSGGHTAGARHPSEAQVVRDLFDRNWAQVTPIMVEENALNIHETAIETARLLSDRGGHHILLVTNEEYMPRALAAFRGRGIDPIPFPVLSLERGGMAPWDLLPSPHGALLIQRGLREILSITWYLISGKVHWGDVFYTPQREVI
jgi:uncharacterized SAM-binding protein YcdF (DUF218 family)